MPAPRTRAVEPDVIEAREVEWMATERGSRRAAAAKDIESGSLRVVSASRVGEVEGRTYL